MMVHNVAMPDSWALLGLVVMLITFSILLPDLLALGWKRVVAGCGVVLLLVTVFLTNAALIWRCPTWFCG